MALGCRSVPKTHDTVDLYMEGKAHDNFFLMYFLLMTH